MVSVAQSPYSNQQIATWLRGLLTIAWSDGDYDRKEQELIAEITHDLSDSGEFVAYKSITPQELAEGLGSDEKTGENFLRTAVLVAIADGIYSPPEAEILHQFSDALGLKVEVLECLEHTLCEVPDSQEQGSQGGEKAELISRPQPHPDLLKPLKHWLDEMEVQDPRLARFICKMVPPSCPFERDITLFGHKIVHVPPMCELNPIYEQLVGLRFRALSYLADECQEDVSKYM
jgi:tellurite resistance protein